MLMNVILAGTAIGAVIGLLHAIWLFRQRTASGHDSAGMALWYALWTLALWTLFGGYLLILWIIGTVLYLLTGGWRRQGAAS